MTPKWTATMKGRAKETHDKSLALWAKKCGHQLKAFLEFLRIARKRAKNKEL